MRCLLFVSVVVACFLPTLMGSQRDVPCSRHANGCSVPPNLRNTFGDSLLNVLTPACNRHDMCYACGRRFGVNRRQCDQKFLANMNTICASWRFTSSRQRSKCFESAIIFHNAVRALGFVHHAVAQFGNRSFCPSVRHCFL